MLKYLRFEIEELFNLTENAVKILSIYSPDDKKKEMEAQVTILRQDHLEDEVNYVFEFKNL